MKNASIGLALAVGIVVILIATATLNGFMLSYMWEWFVVPLGVRSVGIPQAIGIGVLVSMLTQDVSKSAEGEDAISKMLVNIGAKLVAFGIAFGLSFLVPAA